MTVKPFHTWTRWAQMLSVIIGFQVALSPLFVLGGWYMKIQIENGVREGLSEITKQVNLNTSGVEKNKDKTNTIRSAMNHYHNDVNRFFVSGGGGGTSGLPLDINYGDKYIRVFPYILYK